MLKKTIDILKSLFCCAVLVLSLAACDSFQISKQQLEDAKNAPRINLGLVTIREPELYEAKIAQYHIPNPGITLPGRVAGLGFKVLLKGLDTASLNYNFTSTLRKQNFNIAQQLSQDIKRELKTVGYQVFDAPVEDHRHASEFRGGGCLVDPPTTEPCSDFFLHVVIDFAGYTALSHGQAFVPLLRTRIQLVSTSGLAHKTPLQENWHEGVNGESSSYKVLYAATITYGGPTPVSGPTDIVADPKFSLRDRDDLDQSDIVIKGLTTASKAVAEKIAHNLK